MAKTSATQVQDKFEANEQFGNGVAFASVLYLLPPHDRICDFFLSNQFLDPLDQEPPTMTAKNRCTHDPVGHAGEH